MPEAATTNEVATSSHVASKHSIPMRGRSCTWRRDRCCVASPALVWPPPNRRKMQSVTPWCGRWQRSIATATDRHRSGGIIGWLVGYRTQRDPRDLPLRGTSARRSRRARSRLLRSRPIGWSPPTRRRRSASPLPAFPMMTANFSGFGSSPTSTLQQRRGSWASAQERFGWPRREHSGACASTLDEVDRER